ncbi:MAG TPA: FAD-dependent oxidoreductase [Steroidobacteraceae bacterium]|nr:FAD-dependent oxidoreductase [Steroidobacteraceae bacterium]
MARNPRYDVLFEPVRIGPVTARNRFYAVPHASGMTNSMPHMRAAFRETKAEGGWGVVCTGYVSIDPASDDAPLPYATLWDEDDVRAHALMTAAVHRHGALAGIELWHGGGCVTNRLNRIPSMSPSGTSWMPTHVSYMGHQRPRVMDREDIRALLDAQKRAAQRARSAGFDIVYVYAGMGYLPYEFLLPEWNHRTDAYGGSLRNRVRIVRELLEATRDGVGGDCAVALRISLEELRGRPSECAPSEAHEVVQLLADLPDLWDVKMDSESTDCAPSRFTPEGSHEPVIAFVKSLTDKPVVGVGRFTSPDAMVGQIRRGVLDLIGGARPSIADPFLPRKIDEGREEDIRECIGCNICISSWHDGVPVRCTQNPTIGEEWRRQWHPDRVPPAPRGAGTVLVVGAGPAGLECALTLGRRGYEVMLAEAADELGGRLRFETRLPGLATWSRVLEWRRSQLQHLPNVSIYRGNRLGADDILELRPAHVTLATGARWMPFLYSPLEVPAGTLDSPDIYTPDDVAAGVVLEEPVVVFDFDNYYMGSALAEHLARAGRQVRYVTPSGYVSAWAVMTNEQPQTYRALEAAGVEVHTLLRVESLKDGELTLVNVFTSARTRLPCRALVIIGARLANDALYHALTARHEEVAAAGIASVTRVGDALAPGAIAHAVYNGHRYARELEAGESARIVRRDAPLRSMIAPETSPHA